MGSLAGPGRRDYRAGMARIPPELAPFVTSLTVYDATGDPGLHIGMPSTQLTLVLAVGDPLDVGWAGRESTRRQFWANVSGLHAGPAEIRHGTRQAGVCLGLRLAAARPLLGMTAGPLAGVLADAGDVAPSLRWLPEQLAETERSRWATVVGATLVRTLGSRDATDARPEVRRALARLAVGTPVAEVADEVGFSRRHLGDLVRAETGMSPKQWHRLARFQRSHRLVRAGEPLAQVATSCGYADQAHLTREWTSLAGCGPAAWRRRELPSVQDRTPVPGEG